jgi:hypothetical protein
MASDVQDDSEVGGDQRRQPERGEWWQMTSKTTAKWVVVNDVQDDSEVGGGQRHPRRQRGGW